MTTANLRVGIDTSEAFASLKALRAEMQNQPHNLVLSVDPKSVDREIAGYLKQRSFKIKVDTRAMGAEIENDVGLALDRAFNRDGRKLSWNVAALRGGMNAAIDPIFNDTQRRLRFDRDGLTAQVRAAVEAGLTGGTIRVTGAVGAVAGATGSIDQASMNIIREKLSPAVDAMIAAANQIASAARRSSVGGTVGSATAKRSISVIGEDGFSRSFSEKLANPAEELSGILARRTELDLTKEQLKAEKALLETRAALVGQRVKEVGQVEALRARGASKIDVETLLGLPSRDEMKTMGAQIAAQMRDGVKAEALRARSASGVDAQTLLGLPSRDSMKSMGALIAAQMRDGVRAEGLRASAASNINVETLLGLPTRDSMRSMGKQIAAQMREQVKLDDAGWAFGPDRSTFDASQAARRHTEAAAAAKVHKEATKDVSDAHRVMAGSMREAHSAARGLAGSMGAMWATYGSVVPLVAAAALGASIKSVISTGKDLEYQLTFVSALTDNTVVSTNRLAQAIAGSAVAPVQAAEAMRGLAQNGLDVNQAFQALPSILALATAGEMSLADAALGATGVMAAFNKNVSDLGQISDVFAKAAAMSNTDVKSMVEAMKQASTVGDQFNVTMEETSAALAMMAKRNISGSAAGTAFRNMMKELAAPTKQAKAAIDELGLQFFDANGKLKPLQENLQQVATRIAALNEESKLAFIDRIFGERGGKAANAILSDLQAYTETLDTLKNKATGFSKEVSDALAQTTDGRLKVLLSEFKTEAAKAFDDASGGVNNFVEAMRQLVKSKEFQDALNAIMNGVTRLTTFLLENTDAVKTLLLVWASAKALSIAVTVLSGLSTAAYAAATGVTALSVAGRAMLGAMTGGLALVAGLAIEFLVLSRNVDAATEADRAHARAIDNGNSVLQERIQKMALENQQIERKNQLMRDGMSESDANKRVSEESQKKDKFDVDKDLASKQSQLDAALAKYKPVQDLWSGYARDAKSEVERLAKEVYDLQQRKELMRIDQMQTNNQKMGLLENNRLTQIQAFEREVAKAREAGIKVDGLLESSGLRGRLTQEQFENNLAVARDRLNALKEKRDLPSNQAHSEEIAHSKQLIAQLNAEEQALQQQIKFRKQLEEAKYSSNLYGPYVAAALAEQRQITETTKLLDLERSQLERLKALRDGSTKLTPADRTNLTTEIEKRQAQFDLGERELVQLRELARVKQEVRLAEESAAFDKDLKKAASDVDFDIRKIRDSYAFKAESPRDRKADEAARAAEERYRTSIVSLQEKLVTLQGSEARLLAERAEILLAGEEVDTDRLKTVETTLEATRQGVALEGSRLAILQAQARASGSRAGSAAGSEYDNAQTAQYGMLKFWEQYKDSATSNAKIVEDTLRSTTTNMSDAFAQFCTTGDGNFRQFARNIAATAAKMLADKAIAQLIGMAVNYVMAPSANAAGGANSAGFGSGVGYGNQDLGVNFAKGGVMTSEGPLPLRYYAKGGVEHGPAVSIHGEGSLPEANVPLPDGRTIPVTISGGANGGNTYVNMSVKVDSDGKSQVESDTSGEKAAKLGQMIDDAVTSVIAREKRPGGLLYA